MIEYVIDTSVVIKWFVKEKYSEYAIKILNQFQVNTIVLHAPTYLKIEVVSVLRKYWLRKILTKKQVHDILNAFFELPLQYHEIGNKGFLLKALNTSLKQNISFYDSIFVTLAQALNAKLLTADKKLHQEERNFTKLLQEEDNQD